jgi:hypothetical protein
MKTHKSKDICEFAKRWYYKGKEITAFPIHSLIENLKRYYLLQNSISDSRKKGYELCEETGPESMIKLIQTTGKKSQAFRIYKLYKLFDAIVGIKTSETSEEHIGNIRKVLLANWNIPKENLDKISEINFRDHINFVLEEYFLDLTSDGNNEMMTMKDLTKKWEKKCNTISPDLWKDIRVCNPIVSAFHTCWFNRSAIMDKYYCEFANDKDKLRASLKMLSDLPCISERIVNTRNSHTILAAQSRLVKTLLDSLMIIPKPEDEMSLEDWMSQMTTIHSNDGNEEVS